MNATGADQGIDTIYQDKQSGSTPLSIRGWSRVVWMLVWPKPQWPGAVDSETPEELLP